MFYTRNDLNEIKQNHTPVGMIPLIQSIESDVIAYEQLIGASSC